MLLRLKLSRLGIYSHLITNHLILIVSQMESLLISPMSAPDPGKVMVEFVTGGETCVRVMLIVKYKEEESAASMAVKKTVFSLVSRASF